MRTHCVYKMRELCEITSSKRIYAADYKPAGFPFTEEKRSVRSLKGILMSLRSFLLIEISLNEFDTDSVPQLVVIFC